MTDGLGINNTLLLKNNKTKQTHLNVFKQIHRLQAHNFMAVQLSIILKKKASTILTTSSFCRLWALAKELKVFWTPLSKHLKCDSKNPVEFTLL